MEIQLTKMSMDNLLTKHNKTTYTNFLEKLTNLKNSLQEKNPELLSQLPDYNNFLYQEKLGKLYNQFQENIELWKQNNNTVLQPLYMEFGGATTDPYDTYAMFYGYADCDDSLALKKELFDTSGDLELHELFDGIDDLFEKYDDYYEEIRAFYTYSDFFGCRLNIWTIC